MRQKRIMHRLSVAVFRKWQSGGWQNVPDMVLSIGYSSAGLHDLGQDIFLIMEVSGINNI